MRATRPILSGPDAFWHWDLGRRIVSSWLPSSDPYSFLREESPWILNQWGADAIFGLTDAVGGLYLLGVLGSFLVGFAVLATGYLAWSRMNTLAVIPWLGLVVSVVVTNSALRGNLFTFIMVPLLLGELRRRAGPRVTVVAVLMLVWANLHGAFLLGVAFVIIDTVARLLVVPGDSRVAVARHGGLLVVVSAVAGALTPYGFGFLSSTASLVSTAGRVGITEWGPTPITRLDVIPFTALAVIALIALSVTAQRRDLPDSALIVASVVFGLAAVRNVASAAIAIVVLAAPYVEGAVRDIGRVRVPGPRPPSRLDRGLAIGAGLVGVVVVGALVPTISTIPAHARGIPFSLIQELDALPREARVASVSTWSGAIAALTGPHVRTAVDGRLELFSADDIDDARQVEQAGPRWQDILAEWCVTDLVVPSDGALATTVTEHGEEWASRGRHPVLGHDDVTATWFVRPGGTCELPQP